MLKVESKQTPVRTIKMAHVITRLIIGGAQENTVLTVLGLQADPEFEVDLISGCEIGPEGRLNISDVKSVIFEPSLVRNVSPIKDILCFFRLIRLFKRKKYHIVHTHSAKAGILARLAARIAGVPLIVHTVHGLPFHPYQNGTLNGLFITLEYLCALFTDKFIVVSNEMKNKMLQKGIGKEMLFETIFSGMRLDDFLRAGECRLQMRRKLGILPGHIVIGKIARFFPLKGHEFILDIAGDLIKKHPQIMFLFVGDGILIHSVQRRIQEMGLEDHFIFTGLVEPEQISLYLSAIDILVHASLREGLARVLPQAMAAGVPALSFDIDGASEVIKEGVTGFLVQPKQTQELKNKISILIDNPDLRIKISREGRKIVDPVFRHDYMVDRIKNIYKRSALLRTL
ncbi:MAG: glycosyltransferase family 4 protein [Candidatus Aureabacteria bacterium]|nr:glycosyltransferase family 4 protein [Candidatus Auribacterota bacterium]